jgi:hypothetical protein
MVNLMATPAAPLGNVYVSMPSGYIPAPRESATKQALLQFLANVGGNVASQYIGSKMPLSKKEQELLANEKKKTALELAKFQNTLAENGLGMQADQETGEITIFTLANGEPVGEGNLPPGFLKKLESLEADIAFVYAQIRNLQTGSSVAQGNYNAFAGAENPIINDEGRLGDPPPPSGDAEEPQVKPPQQGFAGRVLDEGLIPAMKAESGGAPFWKSVAAGAAAPIYGPVEAGIRGLTGQRPISDALGRWVGNDPAGTTIPHANFEQGNAIVQQFEAGEITRDQAQQALQLLYGR